MATEHYYLVTGASSGIGYATALSLAENKRNKVIAIARNKTKLAHLKKASGDVIDVIPFDLESGDYSALISELKNKGVTSITGLINNAGSLLNKDFSEITIDELKQSYQVNVFGPFLLTQQLLPLLKSSNAAHVVNIASMGGVQGSVKFPGLSAYSSSKGALCVLTESLALELSAFNIKVNCLALGAVQTEMLQVAFPGYEAPLSSEQMGEFVAWFTMNGNKFFNGKILPVALSTP